MLTVASPLVRPVSAIVMAVAHRVLWDAGVGVAVRVVGWTRSAVSLVVTFSAVKHVVTHVVLINAQAAVTAVLGRRAVANCTHTEEDD
jgi:hypothetical protein